MLLLESHRHSRDMEKDLNRDVRKAEWKVKEQKLQDDIKTLREKLLVLVSLRRLEATCTHHLVLRGQLSPPGLAFTGSGTVLTRSPALLHAGSFGVGLGGEPSPTPAAQHGGRPEERPGTQPAGGPAGPGHAAASRQKPGNLQTPLLCRHFNVVNLQIKPTMQQSVQWIFRHLLHL